MAGSRARAPGPGRPREPARATGGVPLPPQWTPQLATLTAKPPRGDEWLHEIKLDGYRLGCRVDGTNIRLITRRGLDWTTTFPEVAAAVARALPAKTALLDGEVAVLEGDGRTSFDALQQALSGGDRRGLKYFVFDLLHFDGEDIAALPLEVRKRRLRALMAGVSASEPLRFCDHVVGQGDAVLAGARNLGLEGIVSKRADQPYRPGRGPGWLKVKCLIGQELVVGGFSEPQGSRQGLGALLCGYYTPAGTLCFAGRVGTGFSERVARELRGRLDALETATCPFSPPPEPLFRRGARWARPELVVEIRFRGWTRDGHIRQSSFIGLRADKPARDVTREIPQDAPGPDD